jgi:hypothetical protein
MHLMEFKNTYEKYIHCSINCSYLAFHALDFAAGLNCNKNIFHDGNSLFNWLQISILLLLFL